MSIYIENSAKKEYTKPVIISENLKDIDAIFASGVFIPSEVVEDYKDNAVDFWLSDYSLWL